jgi:hypothetical protein
MKDAIVVFNFVVADDGGAEHEVHRPNLSRQAWDASPSSPAFVSIHVRYEAETGSLRILEGFTVVRLSMNQS